jgi:hypothetical protein
MVRSRECGEGGGRATREERWADWISVGDVFDPIGGCMRGYVIDHCNLRPLPVHQRENACDPDLLRRFMSWLAGTLRLSY